MSGEYGVCFGAYLFFRACVLGHRQAIALCALTSIIGTIYITAISGKIHGNSDLEADVRPILFQYSGLVFFTVGWISNAIRNVEKDDLPWIHKLIGVNKERLINVNIHITAASILALDPNENETNIRDAISWTELLRGCQAAITKCIRKDESREELLLTRYSRKIRIVSEIVQKELQFDPMILYLLKFERKSKDEPITLDLPSLPPLPPLPPQPPRPSLPTPEEGEQVIIDTTPRDPRHYS